MHQGAVSMRHGYHIAYRFDDACFVIGEHDADQGLGSSRQKLIEGEEIDDALAINRDDIHLLA